MARYRPSYEQILLGVIKGSVFVVPFLVWYISWDAHGAFVTGRTLLFRILVELSLVCWLGLVALRRRYLPSPHNPLVVALCLFLVLTGLADLTGLDPYGSFWGDGDYERMEGYLSLLHLGAFFAIVMSVLKEKDWRILWRLFLVAGVMTACYTLFTYFVGSPIPAYLPGLLSNIEARADMAGATQYQLFMDQKSGRVYWYGRFGGNLGNANFLSTYLLLTGGVALLLCATTRSRPMRLLYGAAALLQFVALLIPTSRAVMLALPGGGLLFCLLYSVIGEHRSYRRLTLVFTVILASSFLLFFVFRESRIVQDNPVLSRFSSIADPALRSRQSRLDEWALLWKGVRERPLLGWGQEQAGKVVIQHVDLQSAFVKNYADSRGRLPWFDRAHNVLLEWLINAGILGLLSYLSLFGCAIYLLWRSMRHHAFRAPEAITLLVILASYLFQNLFYFDSLMSSIIFFAMLAYIARAASNADHSAAEETPPCAPDRRRAAIRSYAVFFSALAVFTGIALIVNVRPYLQARAIVTTVKLFKTGNLDLVIDQFDRALSYHTVGDTATRAVIFTLAERLYRDPRQPYAVKARILSYATQEYEKEVKANPSDPRAHGTLAALYEYQQVLDTHQSASTPVMRP